MNPRKRDAIAAALANPADLLGALLRAWQAEIDSVPTPSLVSTDEAVMLVRTAAPAA